MDTRPRSRCRSEHRGDRGEGEIGGHSTLEIGGQIGVKRSAFQAPSTTMGISLRLGDRLRFDRPVRVPKQDAVRHAVYSISGEMQIIFCARSLYLNWRLNTSGSKGSFLAVEVPLVPVCVSSRSMAASRSASSDIDRNSVGGADFAGFESFAVLSCSTSSMRLDLRMPWDAMGTLATALETLDFSCEFNGYWAGIVVSGFCESTRDLTQKLIRSIKARSSARAGLRLG